MSIFDKLLGRKTEAAQVVPPATGPEALVNDAVISPAEAIVATPAPESAPQAAEVAPAKTAPESSPVATDMAAAADKLSALISEEEDSNGGNPDIATPSAFEANQPSVADQVAAFDTTPASTVENFGIPGEAQEASVVNTGDTKSDAIHTALNIPPIEAPAESAPETTPEVPANETPEQPQQ